MSVFNEFLASSDRLRVYRGRKLIFSSARENLLPLIDYIDGYCPCHQRVVIYDKIVGNAAALLSVLANCHEIYSPLGSQLAIATLDRYHVRHHLTEVVPYIKRPDSPDMCPMEELSIDKDPGTFYAAVKNFTRHQSRIGKAR